MKTTEKPKNPTPSYSLFYNSRFYVLASSVLLSFVIVAWFRLAVESDQLFVIRVQQTFGLACLLYWYVAVMISPVGYVIGKARMKHIEFARRAIGVSAFYFAALHAGVALWGQLGGLSQLAALPELFRWSLLGGGFALLILGLMAATSFDGVIRFMTFRRWKWLHRFVYLASIVALLHVWSIGSHVNYSTVQVAAFIMLSLAVGLESFRLTTLFARRHPDFRPAAYFATIFLSAWMAGVVIILMIPSVVSNYHQDHSVEHRQ